MPARLFSFLAALLATTPSLPRTLRGQSASLAAGNRVRVWIQRDARAPGHGPVRLQGTVVSTLRDSIRVTTVTDTIPTVISLHEITRLDRLAGRRSAFWTGAGIGAAVGGLLGVMLGASKIQAGNCDVAGCGEHAGVAIGAIGGVVYGGLLGGITGAIIRRDRWEVVMLGGVSVGISAVPHREASPRD
jgi:hypothetical protein